jgi:hypothetical protein
MKIISFSLWGDNPKYTIGAVKNAVLAKTIYPGWECYFYVSTDVPADILAQLKAEGATLILKGDGNWFGLTWRFLAADIPGATVLVRDTDSRLNLREKVAVEEWLNSNNDFHIMRDHPFHVSRIMGGMWGARNSICSGITEWLDNYRLSNCYDSDQAFLREIVFPRVASTSTVHDPFMDKIPFPASAPARTNTFFVGQVYNPDDSPVFN